MNPLDILLQLLNDFIAALVRGQVREQMFSNLQIRLFIEEVEVKGVTFAFYSSLRFHSKLFVHPPEIKKVTITL